MHFSVLACLIPFVALVSASPVALPNPDTVFLRAPTPSSSPSNGQGVVSAAASEEGQQYVFGGGGCAGPSNGGFDCSGLTQYSLCQAVQKTIPRNSQAQYNAPGGQHIPRASAQPGDLIFWAKGGNCATGVVHVAVYSGNNQMINAPHTGTVVRAQTVWTSSGGESICPDAVRFW